MEGTARGFAHAVDFAATLLPVAEHAIRWYETSWSDRVSALKGELGALATRCVADPEKPAALKVSRKVVFDVFATPATSAR